MAKDCAVTLHEGNGKQIDQSFECTQLHNLMQRFGPVEPSSGNNAGHSVQSRVGVFCTECPALLPEEGPTGPKHCI